MHFAAEDARRDATQALPESAPSLFSFGRQSVWLRFSGNLANVVGFRSEPGVSSLGRE
jgi:hypothetical protein